MDVRLLLTLVLGSASLIFLIIAGILYQRDRRIKNESPEKNNWQSWRLFLANNPSTSG